MIIEEFLLNLKLNRGYSLHTIEAYKYDLTQFAGWVKTQNVRGRWSHITTSDIELYVQYLSTVYTSPTTINRKLACLKSIYRYFKSHKMMDNNPAQPVIFKKAAAHIVTTISQQDIIKAFNNGDIEMKLIIGLLSTTGVRISELINIKVSDINQQDNSISIIGKGKKMRKVYIKETLKDMLVEYTIKKQDKDLVFTKSGRDIRYKLYVHFRACGIKGACNPHAFRHTAATYWASTGANNSTISKALGHDRLETSQKYIDMAKIDTKDMMINNSLLN